MASPEDSTNLNLVKVGRSGRVKVASEDGQKDADAVAFKTLMAKMQEDSQPGGYLHGRGALDHDDVLYLKEQQALEMDAERIRNHNERKAFLAFKMAAMKADHKTTPIPIVEPKPKTGIKQKSLLKNIVEVKPKRQKTEEERSKAVEIKVNMENFELQKSRKLTEVTEERNVQENEKNGAALLGLAYSGSEDEEEENSVDQENESLKVEKRDGQIDD